MNSGNFGFHSTPARYWCHICRKQFTKFKQEEEEIECLYCKGQFCEELEEDNSEEPQHFEPFQISSNSSSQSSQSNSQSSNPFDPFSFIDSLLSNNRTPVTGASAPVRNQAPNDLFQSILNQVGLIGNSPNNGVRTTIVRFDDGLGGVGATGSAGARSLLGGLGGRAGGGLSSIFNDIFGVGAGDRFEGGMSLDQILQYILENDPNRYGPPPASKKVVESLPKVEVTEEFLKEKNECSVCKEIFQLDDKPLKMPCVHFYHEDCIIPWLKEHNSCPTCRYELPTDDLDYENRKQQTGSGNAFTNLLLNGSRNQGSTGSSNNNR